MKKKYTFKKKTKSFDKTYGEKYIQQVLDNIMPLKLDYMCAEEKEVNTQDIIKEDIDLECLSVIEEETKPIERLKTMPERQEDDNYGLIYRIKKNKVVSCKVPKRTFLERETEYS